MFGAISCAKMKGTDSESANCIRAILKSVVKSPTNKGACVNPYY
jgi:hypothetical protein